MKLNLGSGEDYMEGWVNVDRNKKYKADIYFDLNTIPYPIEENKVDEIVANMVLEHLNNPIGILKEFERICKDGAKISIIVPHATTYANFSSFDHRANFTESSFNKDLLYQYGLLKIELIKTEFIYVNKWKKYMPFKNYLKIFLNGIYDDILFELRVVKKESEQYDLLSEATEIEGMEDDNDSNGRNHDE